MTSAAPFFDDQARFDGRVDAVWAKGRDGVRVRLAHYAAKGDARGTVLLFPGRTEHVEKYGPTAMALTSAGWHVVAVDWRGQALSQRLLPNPMVGHVARFTDYQYDVEVLLDLVEARGLPGPRVLLAHSMGGAIGLRSLVDGLDVEAAFFSAPMWGIQIAPTMRKVAWAVTTAGRVMGLGRKRAPGTSAECYLAIGPFEDNSLTTDPDMWAWMQGHLTDRPELQLGGPSIIWLFEAMRECHLLSARASPDLPCLTILGDEEQIVDSEAIHARMAKWPKGTLELFPGKRHEILMDTPDTQARVRAAMLDHFNAAALVPA